MVDSSTKPEAKVAKEDFDYTSEKVQMYYEYGVDIPISSNEIGENSKKTTWKEGSS